MAAIARFFRFADRQTNFATEVRAGVTTFLTMAYILFVNPQILSDSALGEHAMSFAAAAAGTALAAGVTCILMGLISNFPLALASGMGLNAFIAYNVILAAEVPWQTAMGLVVLDGLIVLLLVLAGVRGWVLRTIPLDLKRAIGAGIGLLLATIGLVNARIVVVPTSSALAYADAVAAGGQPPALPPVTFGAMNTWGIFLVLFGLVLTAVLHVRRVRGAVLIGILATTALSIARDTVMGSGAAPVANMRFALPDFSALGAANVLGALSVKLLPLLLAFVIVDFFDTLGTMTAVGEQAGLVGREGEIERTPHILAVDATGAVLGGLCGASSVTSYVESAAGISEGGRTGLMPVVTGLLFLASLLAAPLLQIVPPEATAPALIFVGFLMAGVLRQVAWADARIALPAFVTVVTMPLTYSISHGVGYGLITYVLVSALSGKWREVHPLMYAIAGIFAASFVWLGA